MKTIPRNKHLFIAVPYYGTLSLPPSGLTRVFFLAEVAPVEKVIIEITLQVWDPKTEPNLFFWLRQMEADGLICSDSPSNYGVALQAEGIWVQWGQEGEVKEVVEKWLFKGQGAPRVYTSMSSISSCGSLAMESEWEPQLKGKRV